MCKSDSDHLDWESLKRKRRRYAGSDIRTRISTTSAGPVAVGGKETNTNWMSYQEACLEKESGGNTQRGIWGYSEF